VTVRRRRGREVTLKALLLETIPNDGGRSPSLEFPTLIGQEVEAQLDRLYVFLSPDYLRPPQLRKDLLNFAFS